MRVIVITTDVIAIVQTQCDAFFIPFLFHIADNDVTRFGCRRRSSKACINSIFYCFFHFKQELQQTDSINFRWRSMKICDKVMAAQRRRWEKNNDWEEFDGDGGWSHQNSHERWTSATEANSNNKKYTYMQEQTNRQNINKMTERI